MRQPGQLKPWLQIIYRIILISYQRTLYCLLELLKYIQAWWDGHICILRDQSRAISVIGTSIKFLQCQSSACWPAVSSLLASNKPFWVGQDGVLGRGWRCCLSPLNKAGMEAASPLSRMPPFPAALPATACYHRMQEYPPGYCCAPRWLGSSGLGCPSGKHYNVGQLSYQPFFYWLFPYQPFLYWKGQVKIYPW